MQVLDAEIGNIGKENVKDKSRILIMGGVLCGTTQYIKNQYKKEILEMRKGTVKWFNNQKGYGFLKSEDGKDVFLHYSNIEMDGFKELEENDVVSFELGAGNDGREQAVNVTPIVTMKMIKSALMENGCDVRVGKSKSTKEKRYYVHDKDDALQTNEDGMTFAELASYAEIPVEIAAMVTTIKE